MNHTEGPWWVEPADDGDDGCQVCDGYGHTATVWGEPEVAMANAKLIAAAPELLEALRATAGLLNYALQDGGIRGCNAAEWEQMADSVRGVIAKAEGRGE
jgi:hypothetical protein